MQGISIWNTCFSFVFSDNDYVSQFIYAFALFSVHLEKLDYPPPLWAFCILEFRDLKKYWIYILGIYCADVYHNDCTKQVQKCILSKLLSFGSLFWFQLHEMQKMYAQASLILEESCIMADAYFVYVSITKRIQSLAFFVIYIISCYYTSPAQHRNATLLAWSTTTAVWK